MVASGLVVWWLFLSHTPCTGFLCLKLFWIPGHGLKSTIKTMSKPFMHLFCYLFVFPFNLSYSVFFDFNPQPLAVSFNVVKDLLSCFYCPLGIFHCHSITARHSESADDVAVRRLYRHSPSLIVFPLCLITSIPIKLHVDLGLSYPVIAIWRFVLHIY